MERSLTREQGLESVGPGWSKIINSLYDRIEAENLPVKVKQVKEKFGWLRFYYDHSELEAERWETFANAVVEAENLSGVTCEFCGEPGKTRNISRYWIKTFCDACGEQRGALIGGQD